MPRRKKPRSGLEPFTVTVTASAASVSVAGPKLSRHDPDGRADSTIRIEGTLDKPVLRRSSALIYVFCGEDGIEHPGRAIGATTAWQLVFRLPREQFADLLAIVAAQRLETIYLLIEDLKRGSGRIRSVSFYTAPVPSERETKDTAEE